jgi:hypothetical protein
MCRQWIALVVVAVALVAAGCNNQQQTVDVSSGAPRMAEPVQDLPAQAGSPIADIPMPVGFSLDQEHSRNAAAAGFRWIDHAYQGEGDKRTVHAFFKRQMPISRWVLMRDTYMQGEIQLTFENSRESCLVTITDGHSMFFWKKPINVNVVVLPMGKIVEEPAAGRSSLSVR